MLDRLTLDQLRILVAVAETGSFSAAARRLRRVQSAISQAVQGLEDALGIRLFDRAGKLPALTEAGRAILADARRLLGAAETLKERARSIADEVEPELSLAVDAMFPDRVLMSSLAALGRAFPLLPVALFTEGLGGSKQRLREGAAQLALYVPFGLDAGDEDDLDAEPLTDIAMIPVVAVSHPLAARPGPLARDELEGETQLVLTDRTPLSQGLWGGILSRRIWRFADLGTRLDYLLAGFGWCNMPEHLVAPHIAAGRLVRLDLPEFRGRPPFPIHVVRRRGHQLGRAGRWLVADLRARLAPL